MGFGILVALIIGCSIEESNCGLKNIPQVQFEDFFASESVEYEGIEFNKVGYYVAVSKGNSKGMMKPSWVTQNYEVYPTHSYPYEVDASVYFSKQINEFRVMSERGVLEMQDFSIQ